MKTVIAGLSVMALAVAVLPAAAASINDVNDNSWAAIKYYLNLDFKGTNLNEADIQNTVTAEANSGGNTNYSVENQSNTTISTGTAESVAVIENTANEIVLDSSIEVEFGAEDQNISTVHDTSNAEIANEQFVNENFDNLNGVWVGNTAAVASNSGENTNDSGEELNTSNISAGGSISGVSVLNSFNRISETFRRIVR